MRRRLFGAILGLVLVPAAVGAQRAPRPEDVATVDGILRAYYEVVSGPAGEAADVERDRSLHHADAWVAIANVDPSGTPSVRVMTLTDTMAATRLARRVSGSGRRTGS